MTAQDTTQPLSILPRPPADRARSRSTLAVRITALCLLVAGVAAVVAGLVSARLVISTSREVAQQTLSDQADVVAELLGETPNVGGIPARVTAILAGQDVQTVHRRGIGGQLLSSSDFAQRAVREAGIGKASLTGSVHKTVSVDGHTTLVEARPLGTNGLVALIKVNDASRNTGQKLVRNIVFALGIGLVVAAVAGLLLARLLAKPLRRTAGVATSMSHGRRDLRAPVDGPREVADVAESINGLADALQRSEGRQRDFLLSVSHELRTPLTAVKGFAESLADGVVTGEDVPAAARTIGQEANRLDRLVSDLLDLARLGADDFRLDLTEVDLTALVADTGTVWRTRCEQAGVLFTVDSPAGPVPVRTDPRRLRQVLDGLAENALRVTPAGRPIVLSLRTSASAATLQVRDGGPGLSDEDYRLAFQRGALHSRYQGTRPVGTGIGLSLVHGLVTRMGGSIAAGPAAEGGACFTVTLPTG